MQKAFAAVLSLLLFATIATAQVKGPAEIKLAIGELSESIDLTVDADEFRFDILGSKLRAIREYSDPKTIKLTLIGYVEETGWVVVSSAKGGKLRELAKVKVVVGEGGPKPGPTPGPVEDPLVKGLRAAAVTDPDKNRVPFLASVYQKVIPEVDTQATWGDLFARMTEIAKGEGVSGKLPAVQGVIQVYLKERLPWKGASDTLLDATGRAVAKEAFQKVADALLAVAKEIK